jgi:hypothetical protein
MTEIRIVWTAVALVCLCLLFPPYGYSRYSVFYIPKSPTSLSMPPTPETVTWTYLRHSFIFARPFPDDPTLDARFPGDATTTNLVSLDDYGIGWPIVGIECFLVIAVAGTLVYSLRRRSN